MSLIKRCSCCGKKFIKDRSNGWDCCADCYFNQETVTCIECGKEITKFDFDDFSGLCGNCHDDVSVCKICGRETTRTNNFGWVCLNCKEAK